MDKIRFEYYEFLIIVMFEGETRSATIKNMEGCLPYIRNDRAMTAIVENTIKKADQMTDEEYLQLNLERYRLEAEEE